ncbi:GIY-YIG nuclease family protein [Spongiivirga sp. MCCC 1A20706]|uniref:GIY-YIG nuclease family protein n=1 Tax=Spongiivirga sp. MCCC 1A20706 TaxID=3160963 RepID=UPI0039776F37
MFYVYVLYSQQACRYYIGMTADLEARLKTHNSGSVKSTKAFIPWKMIHFEKFSTRLEARKREKYLKSAAGRRWRKRNLGM